MEWISFAEERPDKPGRYLVYHYYTDTIQVYFWDGKQWEYGHKITHWKPVGEKPTNAVEVGLQLGFLTTVPPLEIIEVIYRET